MRSPRSPRSRRAWRCTSTSPGHAIYRGRRSLPRLLANLYALPEGIEYRFLSRHLVLLDSDADLIIDLVRNVIPSSVRREP